MTQDTRNDVWGAHATRVLVEATRLNVFARSTPLSLISSPDATASRSREHAGRVRSPETV